ncbi:MULTISPECIES: hypothetical protein [unclassified Micromonospora]|uniref:hypothetical protein n=1 Tax=unclassified Micromonospora TaxID=2617518 RepID=UPI0033165675
MVVLSGVNSRSKRRQQPLHEVRVPDGLRRIPQEISDQGDLLLNLRSRHEQQCLSRGVATESGIRPKREYSGRQQP